MTLGAGSIEKPLGFRVGEECGDLRRNVGPWEWLGVRPEFRHEPVEESIPVWVRESNSVCFMLGLQERLPSGFVQRKEGVIVNTVARGAVGAYNLPDGAVRPGHLRPS